MSTITISTASRGRHAIRKNPRGTRPERRGWVWGGTALLAVLAYAPLLAVRPGVVTPDTKTYLYLDPLRFLSQVPFMWNPTVGTGHGDARVHRLPAPDGPVLRCPPPAGRAGVGGAAAVDGVHPLRRGRGHPVPLPCMGLRGPGPVAAATAYMLSPYFLQYAARISVILLPWAGLPFMLAFAIVALRGAVARARPLRHRGGAGQRHQREFHHLRRRGADPVAPLRRGGAARVDLAQRRGDGIAHHGTDAGGVPVVDGRARGGGGLRRQRPQVHGDGLLDVAEPPTRPRSCGAWGTGTSTAPTTSASGPTRPSASPSRSACWSPPMPYPCWRSSPPRSCAGASLPSSWCSSSSAWCSRSGPSRTTTPRGSGAPSRTS